MTRPQRPSRPRPLEPLEPRSLLTGSIAGVVFADLNADGQRAANEPGLPGVTVYLDANNNASPDEGETSLLTRYDDPDTANVNEAGSYTFESVPNGTHIVRVVTPAGTALSTPGPSTFAAAPGTSNPASGAVSPAALSFGLTPGQSSTQSVQITMPTGQSLYKKVDVFLLLDDTGSFASLAPLLATRIGGIVSSIQAQLPGVSIAFGVGRFEDYGGALGSAFYGENTSGRPFTLSQPILVSDADGFTDALAAALARTTPGNGGSDAPQAIIEALYQAAAGAGFIGNGDSDSTDSGNAGPAATQTTPGSSGDVPAFSTFTPDPDHNVLAPSGTLGGAGFREGALPIVLLATESPTVYRDESLTTITGVDGSINVSAFTQGGRAETNLANAAGIQQAVTALSSLGAVVVGLGTNGDADASPRQLLEALATATGAINRTGAAIEAGTTDKLSANDPIYFRIDPTKPDDVATAIATAVVTAARSAPITLDVEASDPAAAITNLSGLATRIAPGQAASFSVKFTHESADGLRFDLRFVNQGDRTSLGSIPVVYAEFVEGSRLVLNVQGDDFTDQRFGLSATRPDLAPRLSTNTLPALAVPGDKGKLTVSLVNQGNAAATGVADLKIYLSSDHAIGDDLLLAQMPARSINLAAGASLTQTFSLTLPTTLAAGSYRLLVVADEANGITEISESNNAVFSTTIDVAPRFGTVGTRKNVKLTAVDADGTAAVFSLTGAGVATFNLGDATLTLAGTDATTAIKIDIVKTSPGADGRFSLGQVRAEAGSLKSFVAPMANLLDGLVLAGGSLATLTLGDVTGVVTLAVPGAAPLAFTAQRILDASLLAGTQAVRSIKVVDWRDTDAPDNADRIEAASLGSLTVTGVKGTIAGDFAAGLSLSGAASGATLGKAAVAGTLAPSLPWNVTGDIQSLTVTGSVSGATISARTLKTLTLGGDLLDSAIDLTLAGTKAALSTLKIAGAMRRSTLTTQASLGSLTLGVIDSSRVLAGVTATGLPGAADVTSPDSTIASFTVKYTGADASFVASVLAGGSVGKVTLKFVDESNGGVAHGVAARRIGSVARTGAATLKNLATPGIADQAGDFEVVVI